MRPGPTTCSTCSASMEQADPAAAAAAMRALPDEERNDAIAAGYPVVLDGRRRFRPWVRLYRGEDDCA